MTDPAKRTEGTDRALITGVAWTAGVRWLAQLVGWFATLLIARLLTPADYGIVGMATVYLGLVQLVTDLGIGGAIIQRRGLDADRIARLGGFAALLGLASFLASTLAAGPIAAFYKHDEVKALIIVLSLGFVIGGIATVPRALMYRDLEFKALAWIEAAESVVMFGTTLTMALMGYGYWSLAGGTLAGKSVSTIAANVRRPHRISWPNPFKSIWDEVRMGSQVAAATVAWYLYGNADFAVVGRMLGERPLGAYTFAWTLATIPVEKVAGLLQRVTFSAFAKVQDDRPALHRYLRVFTEALAFIAFPVSIGMAIVADGFVAVVLGPQWADAVAPLRLLCFYAGFRTIATLFPQLLMATNRAHLNLRFNLVALLIMPVIFWLGVQWKGAAGVAAGWIVGYPLVVVPLFMRTALNVVGMSATEYLTALWPALSGTAIMALGVMAVRSTLGSALPVVASLAIQIATGVLTFGAVALLLHRQRLRSYLSIVRSLRGSA